MSKIQDAIDLLSAKGAQRASARSRERPPVRRQADAPLEVDSFSEYAKISTNADMMEKACILPHVAAPSAKNAYKILRTRVMQRMRHNQWKSIMVTSAAAAEGKSTTAINLAISICQDARYGVVLMDLDFARPSIARYLGLQPAPGISDYLCGDAKAHDVLYRTDIDRMLVAPNFEAIESSELLISAKMHSLFDHVNGFGPNIFVIIDMPPVLSTDSVVALGPHIDALLLVVAEGKTHARSLQRANQMIEDIPRVGIVSTYSAEGNVDAYY